jgi:putative membrane protein
MFLPHHVPGSVGFLFAILGGLSWLAIVAGIVLLVIWAVRARPRTTFAGSTPVAAERPEDILARRFAMGEINAEDFTRARDLLRGGPGASPPVPPA